MIESSLGLIREIEAIGRQWRDWRQDERWQGRAVELLCGVGDPPRAPEIVVGREEFSVAGEIMVCLHPECGGFVRGLTRAGGYIYWDLVCECPSCGQRYVIQDC